ncbi:MAG TPA: tripartite tricarboxylate transporter TctB family protein [Azospirillaceae bacterium]|nr:tripartite tricarboxylate transporter TctB family protein [Azospirillaceae bacterium]
MREPSGTVAPRPRQWPQLLVAAGVTGLGVLVLLQSLRIPTTPIYAQVGPKAFPFAVAGGLIALGIALAVASLTDRWVDEEGIQSESVDWPAMGWLLLGLTLNLALIRTLGFIVASTCMFVCVARAFGSRTVLRDLGVGILLASAAYFGFDRLLGINIGAGILDHLF